jgi:glycosyltransferase involved in cell wall biosynthesis
MKKQYFILLIIFIIFYKSRYNEKNNKKIIIYKLLNITDNYTLDKLILIYTNKSENYTEKKSIDLIINQTMIDLIRIKNELNFYINVKKYNIENNYFNKSENPKITLIITLYNQEEFIPLIYSSILNQSFQDIEIIFINDGSTDNPYNILKKYMTKDKRIIYKENKINKGAFYSRIKGVKISKGEYILIIDPDDFLVNDILKKLYETAKIYNLDILQFYMAIGTVNNFIIWTIMKCKSGILYQPQIKDIFYYCETRNIADKFIKREIFLKSIEFMKEKYRKERFFIYDDDVAFYGLIKVSNSYGFLENIGYFYRRDNPKSRMFFLHSSNYTNKIFRSLFSIMKYYFEQSDNNNLEKNLIAYNFFKVKVNNFIEDLSNLTGEFEYIIDVLNLYLKCPFFDDKQKNNLIFFKNKVKIRKNKLKSKPIKI